MSRPSTARVAAVAVPIGTVVITLLIGVLLGRLVRGTDTATSDQPSASERSDATDEVGRLLLAADFDLGDRDHLTAADVVPEPERMIPVLEPVAVSFDDAVGDSLLTNAAVSADAPWVSSGSGLPVPVAAGAIGAFAPQDQVAMLAVAPGSESAGSATAPTDSIDESPDAAPTDAVASTDTPTAEASPDDEAADVALGTPPVRPLLYTPDFGFLLDIPPITFDPCAGPAAGDPVPEGCPPGTGAILLGLSAPPTPGAWFGSGHYLELSTPEGRPCPADTPPAGPGQRAGTLFSRTPMAGVRGEYRPYGTDLAWTAVDMPSTSAADTSWWMDRLETTEWSLDWGMVPSCFVIDADASVSYEVRATGIDVYDRVFTSYTGILGADNPDLRPPTTALAGGVRETTASVTAWTHTEGHVVFRTAQLRDGDTNVDCARAGIIDAALTTPGRFDRPTPVSIYDPAYDQRFSARLPVAAGGRLLVCVDIFHTENPLRPFVTDRVLISAGNQQQPRIVLQGIRRIGDDPIRDGLRVASGADASARVVDYCSSFVNLPEMPPGRVHDVEQTVWECSRAGTSPIDDHGDYTVPIRLWMLGGTSGETLAEAAIPIHVDNCSTESCERPREWFEIPIPAASGRLCGSGFGGACDDLSHLDGVAVMRVEYPIIEGADGARAQVTLLDQIDPGMLRAQPALSPRDSAFIDTDDTFRYDLELSFFSDRPLRIALTTVELNFGSRPDPCFTGEPLPMTEEFSDEFSFVVSGVCAGYGYTSLVHAIDEAGNEYDFDPSLNYIAPARSARFATTVELLGGPDLPELGYIYQFDVDLDRQSGAAFGWDIAAPRTGRNPRCVALDGTVLTGRGLPVEVYLGGTTLDVVVTMDITKVDDVDCTTTSRAGPGVLTYEGSFTQDQLRSDVPLVLTSTGDESIQLRVTIERTGPWR